MTAEHNLLKDLAKGIKNIGENIGQYKCRPNTHQTTNYVEMNNHHDKGGIERSTDLHQLSRGIS